MEKTTLTRQEFYELIWSTPLSQLAGTYAISDNGLRKMCKKYKVPIPFNGYWQKLKFNKPVRPEKLPAFAMDKDAIELPLRGEDNPLSMDVSPETLLVRQIKQDPAAPLTVPDELERPHFLIKETKRHWADTKKHKGDYSYKSPFACLSIYVEKDTQPRALRFFDTLIKLLEYRGHKVIVRESATYVVIGTIELDLTLRESGNRVYNDNGPWRTSEIVPNGRLHLKTGRHSWDKQWLENKTGLESMLAKIVARLELDAEKEAKWREECRLSEIRRREEERIRIEQEAIQRAEQQRTDTLLKQAEQFERAQQIRRLIDAAQQQASAEGNVTDNFTEWVHWASEKANTMDPVAAIIIDSGRD